ncbi:hypothetical protein B9Q01_09905, partial [Candidatus Marsarchaeota G1 archaeon OSP_D]
LQAAQASVQKFESHPFPLFIFRVAPSAIAESSSASNAISGNQTLSTPKSSRMDTAFWIVAGWKTSDLRAKPTFNADATKPKRMKEY